jgi:hypothetical protein
MARVAVFGCLQCLGEPSYLLTQGRGGALLGRQQRTQMLDVVRGVVAVVSGPVAAAGLGSRRAVGQAAAEQLTPDFLKHRF